MRAFFFESKGHSSPFSTCKHFPLYFKSPALRPSLLLQGTLRSTNKPLFVTEILSPSSAAGIKGFVPVQRLTCVIKDQGDTGGQWGPLSLPYPRNHSILLDMLCLCPEPTSLPSTESPACECVGPLGQPVFRAGQGKLHCIPSWLPPVYLGRELLHETWHSMEQRLPHPVDPHSHAKYQSQVRTHQRKFITSQRGPNILTCE